MAQDFLSLRVVRDSFGPKIKRLMARGADLSDWLRDTIDAMHESVLEEFTTSSFLLPGGGSLSWDQHVPFGTKRFGRILWNRGRLKAAMTGGSGSVTRVTKTSAGIGVEVGRKIGGTTLDRLVAIMRGGLGARPRVNQVTTIKPEKQIDGADRYSDPQDPRRYKMWWFIFRQYGLAISGAKMQEGFKIKARPFAAMNPRLEQKIFELWKKHFRGR